MDVAEHPRGQGEGGALADLLEQGVAQIVGQHPAEARGAIAEHQPGDDRERRDVRRHAVDHRFVGERHQQHRRLAGEDQQDRADHPRLELAFALGPQEAA